MNNMLNITFTKPLSMGDPAIYIGKISMSYYDMIFWGLLGLIIFIGLAVWIYTYRRGG